VSTKPIQTEADGQRLTLSNLEKVLYPRTGFTKGEVLDYYARVADVMLPYLRRRPATFRRFPNGVEKTSFYVKHVPSNPPSWVQTILVPAKEHPEEPVEYVSVDDRPTLLWAANLAALEFHVPLWHVVRGKEVPTPPDHMVFDLDPGPGTTIAECCVVARWIAQRVGRDKIFAKTSGSKGLQLYVRVTRTSWAKASERAHELALGVEKDHPDRVVTNMKKSLRNGKILIDWSQNSPAKTTIAAYSLRGREEPTVSTPVSWDEVDQCASSGVASSLSFDAASVMARLDTLGDLMAPLLGSRLSKPKGVKER